MIEFSSCEIDNPLVSKSKPIADEDVPGDLHYADNFREEVLQKIMDHKFKKQTKKKVEYLKPTKATLYGLHLRFRENERALVKKQQEQLGIGVKEEQDSVYMINSQLLAKKGEDSKSPIVVRSSKPKVGPNGSILTAGGQSTIKSRHAIPLDIESLMQEQREYAYIGSSDLYKPRTTKYSETAQNKKRNLIASQNVMFPNIAENRVSNRNSPSPDPSNYDDGSKARATTETGRRGGD